MTARPVFAATLALTLAVATGANAARLCRTKKGALTMREQCRAKESPVNPSDLGLQGPKGDVGAKGAVGQTGPSWHVVDANGKDVGAVVYLSASSDEARVLAEMTLPDATLAEPVQMTLEPSGAGFVVLQMDDAVRYLDTSCSGPQYLPVSPQFATALVTIQPSVPISPLTFYYARWTEVASAQFQQIVPRRGAAVDCAVHDDDHGPGNAVGTDYCYYHGLDSEPGDDTCTLCCQPVWGPDPESGVPGPTHSSAAPAHIFTTAYPSAPWAPPFKLALR